MGTPYQSQSASGYNSSPPPDDGTTVAANKITWAGIKTKLADAIKTLADAINSQLVTTLDVTPTTTSISYTTLVSDHQKPIEASGTITISLGDAATMVAQALGYQVRIVNVGTGVVTVNLATAGNTLDGTSNGSTTIGPKQSATYTVNHAGNGYETIASGGVGGTYTATATGMTTSPTATFKFRVINNNVTLDIVPISGTSNATSFTLTGAPTTIRPAGNKSFPVRISDNGGTTSYGLGAMDNTGVITLYKDAAGTGWTNSGTKAITDLSVSYTLD